MSIVTKGDLSMASKRCLPTRFFKDADIMNVSKDAQLILVGLVLLADDEGRELAHPRLLSREIDYPPEQIEAALAELVENDLVMLYQAGKHCYYSLTRWSQWQTISSQKMTPSKYPAPPASLDEPGATTVAEGRTNDTLVTVDISQKSPEIPRNPQRNDGENWESPTQLNLSECKLSESKSMEDEGEAQPPPNIVPFPAARSDADAVVEPVFSEKRVIEVTHQVAAILNVPVNDGLQRVVVDYLGDPSLSLLGEADAAREWIDDPRRNRKRKPLTPVFFRRWLKREHEAAQRGYAPPGPSTQETTNETRTLSVHATRAIANGIGPPGMQVTAAAAHTENPYQAFVRARAQTVLRQAVSKQEEARREATP
jgi:hypothetical protein